MTQSASTSVVSKVTLPLEDTVQYVLLKAQRGLGFPTDELARRSDVDEGLIGTILEGNCTGEDIPKDALLRLAFVMNLNGPALVKLAHEYDTAAPDVNSPAQGFTMATTPFGQFMTVNAYVVWCPETKQAISFDTGTDCTPLLNTLTNNGATLAWAAITHTHMDHLADLERLLETTGARGVGPAIENPLGLNPLNHGDAFYVGNLKISVLGTHGHTPGGLSYFIEGLDAPMVITGDAFFAASMGGAARVPGAYQQALRTNREYILSLPDNTIVCPGHGPLSTVGHEREWNAFFPVR